MTFFHRPVGLVELLIVYARVQFYTPRASDYRLISKTASRAVIIAYVGKVLSSMHCFYQGVVIFFFSYKDVNHIQKLSDVY